MRSDLQLGHGRSAGLVDVLDRVLDKGLVVAGDIKVSLAEVELLTIRIRLIVCSIDKAQSIGLDWWQHDAHLAPGKNRLAAENEQLRGQVRELERQIARLAEATPHGGRVPAKRAATARQTAPRRLALPARSTVEPAPKKPPQGRRKGR